MGFNKHGVRVDCEQCQCVHSDDCGGFDVTVPVTLAEGGTAGTARLHCVVSADCHRVELMEWRDGDLHPGEPPEEARRRLDAALDFVAAQRLCGNSRLCPAAVVRVVQEQGGR